MRRAALLLAVATAAVCVGAPPAAAQEAEEQIGESPSLERCDEGIEVDRVPYPVLRLGARRLAARATGRGVVIATVDSGIAPGNPHFRGAKLLPGVSLLPGDPVRTGLSDGFGHGTAVAGAIVAQPVRGSGLVGLAPQATLLPVRVFESELQESIDRGWQPVTERISAGIRLAAERGADVINVSMSQRERDPGLEQAVAFAVSKGALVVASAGNRSTARDARDGVRYPAGLPGVLAVGAADELDQAAPASITGPHVDVLAPSPDVLAYGDLGDCDVAQEGGSTSFATAYVSAAAALVAEAYPDAGPEEIAYRLMASADRPVLGQRDDARGWGLVRPLEALSMTIDRDRPGPPVPGAPPRAEGQGPVQRIELTRLQDPQRPVRERTLWWLLAGGLTTGLAVLAGAARSGSRRR